jgi:hypothetical protein
MSEGGSAFIGARSLKVVRSRDGVPRGQFAVLGEMERTKQYFLMECATGRIIPGAHSAEQWERVPEAEL